MYIVVNDMEWAKDLQEGLDNYMDYLMSGLDGEEVETITGEPFCMCGVCENREILAFVVPRAIKGFLDGSVDLTVKDKLITSSSRLVHHLDRSETE